MKKVLSAVLAASMVASMGVSSFAAGIADFGAKEIPAVDIDAILNHDGVNARRDLGTTYVQDAKTIKYDICEAFGGNCKDMVVVINVADDDANNKIDADLNGKYTIDEVNEYLTKNKDVAAEDILAEVEVGQENGRPAVEGTQWKQHDLLTYAEMKDLDIILNAKVVEDTGSFIKSVTLNKKAAQIEIKLADRLVSTDTEDFEIDLAFQIGNKTYDAATIYGSYANKVVTATSSTSKLDIADGLVVDPQDFVESIELYVGEGVTVHTKLWEGKKYYCVADRDADDADQRVMKEYADVDNVVTLYRVGVNNSGDYVTFSNDYAGYFVYGYEDGKLQYLGKGDEEIAAYGDNSEAYTKYYFANKELKLNNKAEESKAPAADKDDEAPKANNNNANPGTGR